MINVKKVLAYQSSMLNALRMLQKSIINREDLVLIESKLAGKYDLKIGSLYREIDLINVAFRANMV